MAQINETKLVLFTEGPLTGEKAYITFEDLDGDYLRVTPISGDPLLSIELSRKQGGFIDTESN